MLGTTARVDITTGSPIPPVHVLWYDAMIDTSTYSKYHVHSTVPLVAPAKHAARHALSKSCGGCGRCLWRV